MAESEELKSFLMKVKEESLDLKLNIQRMKIIASGSITSWQIDGETMETVTDFIFLGSKITADGDYSHEIKRRLLLGRKERCNGEAYRKQRLDQEITSLWETSCPSWAMHILTFHAKTGTIKDRNGMGLTEAEDIKKRWQEFVCRSGSNS